MADYLSEQDQVDLIKKFWKNFGNWVLGIFVLMAFCWSGYRYWEHRQDVLQDAASNTYLSLIDSASKGDQVNVSAKAHYLMQNNSDSAYAGLAALVLASSDVNQGDFPSAQKDLQWVLDHQKNQDLQSMAKIRLARISLEQGEPEDAIKILTPVSQAYAMSFEMVLGDAYAMLSQTDLAKKAYESALKAADSEDSAAQSIIKMKLGDLSLNPV